MPKDTWVFAVHNWETGDGKHHVTISKKGKTRTSRFTRWAKARAFAKKQAIKLGLKTFQIDHPDAPHKMIKVTESKPKQRRKPKSTRKEKSVVENYIMG